MSRHDNRLALGISLGVHVVVFGVFAFGGLFSFLQTHSQPPPVDVTVYNEEAVHESDAPGSSAPNGGGGGGGETYAAPTTAMPEINESYTQAAQTERAVEKVMQEQHVDAATAKQVVAAAQAKTNANAAVKNDTSGNSIGSAASTQGNNGNPPGPGNGPTVGPGINPDAPPGNGNDAQGNGNDTGGTDNSNGNDDGDGKRPAKKAHLVSQPDTASFYPESLRRKHISGSVTVHVQISSDGTVTSAAVVSSSGYPEMDDAAVRLAYQCRYEPAENEYGQAVAAERNIQVPFGFNT